MAIETFGAITVNSDVGADANSYCSVAFARSWWALDPNKDSGSITDEQAAGLAIYATMVLDAENAQNYDGVLYNKEYALNFPRVGVTDSRGVLISDMTTFPIDLQRATAEQMFYLSENDVYAQLVLNGVKRQALDGVGSKEFYDLGELRSALKKDKVSDLASKFLSSFLLGGAATDFTSRFVRG